MSDVIITVVGNIATEPRMDETKKGEPFTSFRIACNHTRYDTRARSWVTEDTSFFTVFCWRTPLAENVKASFRKGDPVVVHGRLKVREWRDDNKGLRLTAEITARTVGHDLFRGTTSFVKTNRPSPQAMTEDDTLDNVRALYLAEQGADLPDHSLPPVREMAEHSLGGDAAAQGAGVLDGRTGERYADDQLSSRPPTSPAEADSAEAAA